MQRLNTHRRAFVLACLLASLVCAAPAAAHGSDASALAWSWPWWIVGSLALAILGYVRGLLRLERTARRHVFGAGRLAAFAIGIATMVAALLSPLDALDDQLFSAHMVQHMLLMLVAPPLLVWGRPATAWLWAFPLRGRRAIGRFWMGTPGVQRSVRSLLAPLSVWLLWSAALWFWHLPGAYGWALANEWVHSAEHVCFFLTSLALWSLVMAPYGRRQLDYGPCLIFVGTLGVQMGLLGALLTFATHPVYQTQAQTTLAWGLTPLQDQQLAGLIMWVPAGFIFVVAMAALFVAWLRDAERKALAASATRHLGVLRIACVFALLLPALALPGCGRRDAASPWVVSGANAARGPALIRAYGCSSCHVVPGVADARGMVGPPLTHFAQRGYIAGTLRNTPDHLILWLRKPQQVLPGNAMPDTVLGDQDARDIAAYLYTLQ
ncbi:MAG: cytochrome c oxidase assembly protein [Rhodanobacter sp.]